MRKRRTSPTDTELAIRRAAHTITKAEREAAAYWLPRVKATLAKADPQRRDSAGA